MSTPRNASSALAATVLDELVRGGVRHVVLSPGSRSAPLAFAAYDVAAAGMVTLHTRIDERTAGFLALGLAKSSRQPVAVVTTSGTATANLHPAMLEAAHTVVPLVALTADRPASLRGTNANQTTNQVELYGDAAAFFADVSPGVVGADEVLQVGRWRALVQNALAGSVPVHLNLQFAEPLVPDAPDGWSVPLNVGGAGAVAHRWSSRDAVSAEERPSRAVSDLADDKRTVVVAGDDAGPPARVLAEQRGWPLLAEPSSGSRTGHNAIRTYRLLLGDPGLADRVERVVVCGHPTLSRPVTRLISRRDLEVLAVPGPHGVTDPGHAVSGVLHLDLSDAPRLESTPWLDEWRARDAEVSARLDEFLDASAELLPHTVARAVARMLPDSGLLVVGASNPIRDLDLVVPRYRVGGRRMVLANRGLSGIDGTVSTAIGAALGRPHTTRAFALLGDVTFLHDATGLLVGSSEARPDLTVVVVNDDGGSIFAGLEQGAPEHRASFDKLFGTPHGVDLGSLCAASGTAHRRVTSQTQLEHALADAPRGIQVVEAVVRRDNRRDLDAHVRSLASPLVEPPFLQG